MIKLTRFNENDIERIINLITSPELCMQWAGPGYKYPLTMELFLNEIKKTQESQTRILMFNAVLENTDQTIGHIQLLNIDPINSSAVIGRVLIGNKNERGKGHGKNLIKAILKYGFETIKLHRISLNVYDFNASAIKCYEDSGFIVEGRSRDSVKMGDKYWSSISMSILENEYEKIKVRDREQTTRTES